MSYQAELVSIGPNGIRVTTTKDGFLFSTLEEVSQYMDGLVGSINADVIVFSGWEDAPTHSLEVDATSGLDVAVLITDAPIDIEPTPVEV